MRRREKGGEGEGVICIIVRKMETGSCRGSPLSHPL